MNEAGQLVGSAALPGGAGYYHAILADAAGGMVDLGTFGGNSSYASAINNAGQVAGHAELAGGAELRAFLYTDGEMTDLGTLGGSYSYARALNEAGQVAGVSTLDAYSNAHAFLYADGVMTDLGTLGGSSSYVSRLNEAGQVLGESETADSGTHAFLYTDGVMTDLGTLGGSRSYPGQLNEAGQVTGYSFLPSESDFHAFLYADADGDGASEMTDLGTFGGYASFPTDLSEAGHVVGGAYLAGDAGEHAFLYRNGVITDLGTFGGTFSRASAVNEAGQVVGSASLAGEIEYHAFVYADADADGHSEMTDLGTFGGIYSYANTISEAGVVIGGSQLAGDAGWHAFVYRDGQVNDLNDLIPAGSGWVLQDATFINGSGQIAGYGTLDGQSHLFLLSPLPSNAPPVAVADAVSGGQDRTIAGNVLTNDTDDDGDPLQVLADSIVGPVKGALVLDEQTGAFSYLAHPGYHGTDSFTYVATDGEADSGRVTVTLTIAASAAGAITQRPDGDLVINGSANADAITISEGKTAGKLSIRTYGGRAGTVDVDVPAGRIHVFGGGGGDSLQVASKGVHNEAWLYGDGGNDSLKLGAGGGVAFGGPGNDFLVGDEARDVLVGGPGADTLGGNGGDDVMIAGFTDYDDRLTLDDHNAAWRGIRAEWTRTAGLPTFAQRVANLLDGTGTPATRLNGGYLLNAGTVRDGGGADVLWGNDGEDWYLYGTGDKTSGLSKAEKGAAIIV